jgi:hypothetical protein
MLALAAPVWGADEQSWGYVESGKEVRVFYGVPDSHNLTIAFVCDDKPKRIEIVSTVLPARPKKGQSIKTTLSNGAVTAAYGGKVGGTSNEGFYVEARTAADPKVVAILKSGTSLTISIPGKQERVPLRGVADPLAQFETACFRRR